jgi:hypothetical protein
MLSYSSILGQRQGNISDTINAGTGAYQASAAQAATQAEADRKMYEDLFNEWKVGQDTAAKGAGGEILSQAAVILSNPNATNEQKRAALSAALAGGASASEVSLLGSMYGVDLKGTTTGAKDLVDQLNDIKTSISGINPLTAGLSSIPGAGVMFNDDSFNKFKTARDLVGMTVAKLKESGRLSDQDRRFYLDNFPTDAEVIANPAKAASKVDAVVDYFKKSYPKEFTSTSNSSSGISSLTQGFSSANKPSLGSIYGGIQ